MYKLLFMLSFFVSFYSLSSLGRVDEVVLQSSDSYEFKFNSMKMSFKGNAKSINIDGRLVLMKKELRMIRGGSIEVFDILVVKSINEELILETRNNKSEQFRFVFSKSNLMTKVKAINQGATLEINVTSGDLDEVKLYRE